jgi:hypothetical protein
VAIGASPIFVRLSEVGPAATAFHRMLWALPLLWLWTKFDTGPHPRLSARQKLRLTVCGLLFVGDLVFWHLSILYPAGLPHRRRPSPSSLNPMSSNSER